MDFSESTKVVYNRIQKVEPESVAKIVGYLLLQDHGDRDMIRLAFSPDNVIQSLINKAKTELGLLSKLSISAPISPSVGDLPLQFTPYSPMTIRSAKTYWAEDYALQNQMQFLALDDQLEPVNSDFSSNYFSRRSEFPVKVCHYFNKGICKHGNNCRYLHGQPLPESFSQIYSQGSVDNDDHLFSPGSLEKLELELAELLKSRRGFPVSIASLPMMYYEKYGRILQADGYLTESQRHGKAGYSLTKLLARLKNSIRLIDRPHGQHSVILVEDVPKYLEYIGGMVSGSRQIYLTFPAESTFTEQDVSNYFNNFGHVQDVRIPCQQKRMFGFVTFVYEETVKQILAKGNPHFVCGARVLVKPYREKSRLVDRKYMDKLQHHGFYSSHATDADSEIHCLPRVFDNSRFIARAEQADERFNYLLDVLNNNGSSGEDKVRRINTGYNDQDSSQGLNLPESPFAPPMASGISTVI